MSKKIKFELEFYHRGKKRTPSVNFVFENSTNDGLHMDIVDGATFKEFSKAAHALCKELIDAGELD